MTSHTIKGWAFTPTEKEGQARFAARYEAIKHRRKELVANLGPSHGAANYSVKTAPDLTPEDLAILCDEGNVCFGAVVDDRGVIARVTIWTD